jgi:hypothetical protein
VDTKRKAKKGHAKQDKPGGHLTNNGEIIFFAKWKRKHAEKGRQVPTSGGQHTTHKYIKLLRITHGFTVLLKQLRQAFRRRRMYRGTKLLFCC